MSLRELRDPVHQHVNLIKEIEILQLIFDDNSEMYNLRISKNTPDVEVRI